ncbi:MAG: LLM class flavin-dependent oxidoreductase [Lachnospiraceae bacterium]|nr:LLM class flavin-dependent oxidoreductase [Lachnospiraceae bacterium]
MRTNSIHKEIKMNLARSGMTLTEVVSRMNKNRSEENQTTIQNISNKIMRGTIKYSEILEIAAILNMSIVWTETREEGM